MLLSVLDFLFTVSGIGGVLSITGFTLMMFFAKRLNPRIIVVMVLNFVITLAFNRNSLEKRLKNIAFTAGTNSHPLERFNVVIKLKDGDIPLQLAMDSKEHSTYWVYYPKYRFFTMNEVGKVRL